jgi:hypothetical protein
MVSVRMVSMHARDARAAVLLKQHACHIHAESDVQCRHDLRKLLAH